MKEIFYRKKNTLPYKMKLVNGTVALLLTAVMLFSAFSITAKASPSPLNLNIVNEGFEHGGTFPPTGWTIQQTNPARTWMITTSPVHSGTYAAMVPMKLQTQNEWLKTPMLDLTQLQGYTSLKMIFWTYTQANANDWDVNFLVHIGGGAFVPNDMIWHMKDPANGVPGNDWYAEATWRAVVLDFTQYIGKTIQCAWQYKDQGPAGYDFALDDITLYAPEITPLLSVGTINYGTVISSSVQNVGQLPIDNVSWTMSMKGGIQNKINISSSGVVAHLVPMGYNGDSASIRLGKTPMGFGKVKISITAESKTTANTNKVSRNATGFVILNKVYPMIIFKGTFVNMFQ